MLLYRAELRRRAGIKADVAEAVAFGYAGCKSEQGGEAMQRFVRALRDDR